MSEEYYERLATNDTAHGGDCMTPEECEADPLCTACGHPRSEHSEEMPYECMNTDMCDCGAFSYVRDREATASEVAQALEQEQILAAARASKRNATFLMDELRKAGVLL